MSTIEKKRTSCQHKRSTETIFISIGTFWNFTQYIRVFGPYFAKGSSTNEKNCSTNGVQTIDTIFGSIGLFLNFHFSSRPLTLEICLFYIKSQIGWYTMWRFSTKLEFYSSFRRICSIYLLHHLISFSALSHKSVPLILPVYFF